MKVTVSGELIFTIDKEEPPAATPPKLVFSIKTNGVTTKPVSMLLLPNDCFVLATIQPVDAVGNPAKIDGLPSWSSSNVAIAYPKNISTDGLAAEIYPGQELGTAQINVVADADLGSGVVPITGVLDVQVSAGTAVGFAISTGPVTPQP